MAKKIGRNVLKWAVFGGSLTSILFSALLIYSPPAFAYAIVRAACEGGGTVSCSGIRCTAQTGAGCYCVDESGTITDKRDCPAKADGDSVALEEGAY